MRVAAAWDLLDKDNKFVASDAPDNAVVLKHRGNAVRYFFKRLIPGEVAVNIVDDFEIIDIENKQRVHRIGGALRKVCLNPVLHRHFII